MTNGPVTTTDPLEKPVMEAADALVEHAALHTGDGNGNFCSPLKASNCYPEGDKLAARLRLHVQLALAKARLGEYHRPTFGRQQVLADEIAALEARLQED